MNNIKKANIGNKALEITIYAQDSLTKLKPASWARLQGESRGDYG